MGNGPVSRKVEHSVPTDGVRQDRPETKRPYAQHSTHTSATPIISQLIINNQMENSPVSRKVEQSQVRQETPEIMHVCSMTSATPIIRQ